MCEFKKGDKIICVNTDNHPELIKDKIYEVEKPNGDFVYLKGCKYGYFTFLFRKKCEYCYKDSELYNDHNNSHSVILKMTKFPNNKTKLGIDLYCGSEETNFLDYIDINYCPMCGRKLGGSMKILEHGNFYKENKIIKCICGCKFEYEQSDIMTDTSLAYTTSPEQYKRYVRCPECDAKTELGTTYVHSITQRY